MQVLNKEIQFIEDRHNGESSLLTATKGVGALMAIVLVLDTILQRGSAD